MDFETFVNEMKEHIKEHLPEKYADALVDVYENQKLNENYLALKVMLPEQKVAPCLNLNTLYGMYEDGTEFEDVMNKVVEAVTAPVPDVDVSQLRNYDAVKDKLFIRASNAEKNAEMLENMPHTMIEDMAITYHVMLMNDGDEGLASYAIHNDMLKSFGISKEQLHEDAMMSTQRVMPFSIVPIEEILQQSLRDKMEACGFPEEAIQEAIDDMCSSGNVEMLVVTNEARISGAGTIFYPDVMDKIAEHFESNFFVIPSSTEEVLAIPDRGDADYRELNDMVCEVNDTQVKEHERLGNQVYHYDAEDKVFEKASSFEERQKAKAAEKETAKDKNSILKKIDEKKREVTDAVKDAVSVKRVAGVEI